MIAHVVKPYGWRPAGLIAYLFGPGRHEEHRNPRVVASWDGAPGFHQPPKLPAVRLGEEVIEPGEFDFDLRPLNATMEEWPRRAKLPVSSPPPGPPVLGDPAAQREAEYWSEWLRASGKRRPPREAPEWVRWHRYDPKAERIVLRPGYVWHCPVRLHADDPTLTDAQWEMIAQRLMTAVGIQQEGARWIAVRHADDHIHLVATLVSETTGRRVYPRNDFAKLRETCQQLEKELGLTPTPDIDWTASRQPTRREVGKAERTGRREPARVELRRVVSQAAAASRDGGEFLRLLQLEGLVVRVQRTSAGEVRGYAVGLPTDVNAEGRPVLYSGSKLARDLTWPKLFERWASTPTREPVPLPRTESGHPTPAARRGVLAEAAEVVNRAAAALHAGHEDGDGVAHAAGEVLATLSAAKEGREPGELSAVLDTFDRATRTPARGTPGDLGPLARELRWAARHLARVGALSGRGHEKFATAALLVALASLIAEIGAWHQMRGRVHHAAAAHRAARAIPADIAGRPTRLGASTRPDPVRERTGHATQPSHPRRVASPPTQAPRRRGLR
ncbi:relaxase/mobilization nuclease domain-containing protein [Actinophytocola sp.]|uniref:relaxase/mobilization nuclease domain-containing protein n=1 Tax=Actinophytocola sp. TaxID=1872138 RepID=UPI00389A771A